MVGATEPLDRRSRGGIFNVDPRDGGVVDVGVAELGVDELGVKVDVDIDGREIDPGVDATMEGKVSDAVFLTGDEACGGPLIWRFESDGLGCDSKSDISKPVSSPSTGVV